MRPRSPLPLLVLLCTACVRAVSPMNPADDANAPDTATDAPLGVTDAIAEVPLDGSSLDQPHADGPSMPDLPPAAVQPQVAVGQTQACALYPAGTVYCWGLNVEGGVGTGVAIESQTIHPPAALSITDGTDLGGGDQHNCVVRADGTAACWGWNVEGAVGNGDQANQALPQAVVGLAGVARIATGRTHSCAVLQSGKVACWGGNFFGQLGWGSVGEDSLSAQIVAGISDALDVSATEGDTCVVRKSGNVVCFGWHALAWAGTGSGYSTTPTEMPGVTDAVAITLGHDHACVIHATGALSCWGNNSDGQLGNGIIGCPGDGVDCPAPGAVVAGLGGVLSVSCSYVHTCAVDGTGQVHCFGWLPKESAGTITMEDVLAPRPVAGLTDAVQVSTNASSDDIDCAVRRNGAIVCWGFNHSGLLGSATAPHTATPVAVPGLP